MQSIPLHQLTLSQAHNVRKTDRTRDIEELVASIDAHGLLENLLVVGRDLIQAKIKEISAEALGRTLRILHADDVGLNVPVGSLQFDDLAAPAGLASFGWR